MAIGLDGHSKVVGSGAGPHTLNHACGGVQRFLLVAFSGMRNSVTSWSVGGMTYNSVALTQLAAAEVAGVSRNLRTELWGMVNPPGGVAHQVSVSTSVNMQAFSLAAISLTGVDQTTPTGASGTDQGSKSSFSVGLTTGVPDAWLVGGAGIVNGTLSWTPAGSMTEIYEQASGSNTTNDLVGCGDYLICTAAGLYSLASSASGSNRGVMVAVEIRPAAAAPAVWAG